MLVIHIGTQKTGTSALQLHLAKNAGLLLEQGIRYLKAGRERDNRISHGELAQSLATQSDTPSWKLLRTEIEKSISRINLISAEGFWFCNPTDLRRQLPDVGPIQIVVYLRRQDQYLQSLWKQAVNGGRKHDFNTWREKLPLRGDYLQTIEQWAEQFGPEAIIIRPYDRDGETNTIRDFCRIIGAEELVDGTPELRRNPSPRRELIGLIRAFNHLNLGTDRHKLFREIITKNDSYIRSCDMFSPDECVALMETYAESNRVLSEKYYRDKSVPLFPKVDKIDATTTWDIDSEEYCQMVQDVLSVIVDFASAGKFSPRQKKKAGVKEAETASDAEVMAERRKRRQKLRAERKMASKD